MLNACLYMEKLCEPEPPSNANVPMVDGLFEFQYVSVTYRDTGVFLHRLLGSYLFIAHGTLGFFNYFVWFRA
jgi:hypothetical protein